MRGRGPQERFDYLSYRMGCILLFKVLNSIAVLWNCVYLLLHRYKRILLSVAMADNLSHVRLTS